MKFRKTTNLLDATSHNVPRFITKKWIGTITVTGTSNKSKKRRFWHLNIMHQLLVAFQKLMIHSLIMQRLRCCNTYIEFD